jgi:hypothetical protein
MWIHRPAENPGSGRLILEGAGPVETTPGIWTRVQLPLSGDGTPVLSAEGGPVVVELDRLELAGVPG